MKMCAEKARYAHSTHTGIRCTQYQYDIYKPYM